MTRSHRALSTAARRFSGYLLTWGMLASIFTPIATARQAWPQFSSDTVGEAQLVVARQRSNVMQVFVDNETAMPRFDAVGLPPNLIVSESLQQMVDSMLRDSPTFRRQCARLSTAPLLTVTVDYVILASPARSLAVTDVGFDRHGRMFAHVGIGQTAANREQVLAHEFEHIVEQLDGVDLAALATHATAGVRLTEGARRFETERAIAIGQQVSDEIRHARRKHE